MIDDAQRSRIKVWGTARGVEGDGDLTPHLMPVARKAHAEWIIVFILSA